MGDDDKRALGAVWEWTHQYGAALKPPGADTYGEGMRDAKEQVQRLLSGASSMSADLATLRAQRDEARALVGQLSTPEKLQLAADMLGKVDADYQRVLLAFAAMRAQRDEARARVRSIANGPLGNAAMSERILSAREIVARWDEEERRA